MVEGVIEILTLMGSDPVVERCRETTSILTTGRFRTAPAILIVRGEAGIIDR